MKKEINNMVKEYIKLENRIFRQLDKLPNTRMECECSHKTYLDTVDYGERNCPYVRRTCLECGGNITIEE